MHRASIGAFRRALIAIQYISRSIVDRAPSSFDAEVDFIRLSSVVIFRHSYSLDYSNFFKMIIIEARKQSFTKVIKIMIS